MAQDPHAEKELGVFRRFAESQGIDSSTVEKSDPPEPDITCLTATGERVGFELAEVVDQELAQAVHGKIRLQQRFKAAYDELPGDQQARINEAVGDCLLNVCYNPHVTFSQRVQLIPAVFDEVTRIPHESADDWDPPETSPLHGLVRTIMVSRGIQRGPLFDVEAGGWIADPMPDRIAGKFSKTYETDDPIELLLYYDIHPDVGRIGLDEIGKTVHANLSSSPFRRVWVFDVHSGECYTIA